MRLGSRARASDSARPPKRRFRPWVLVGYFVILGAAGALALGYVDPESRIPAVTAVVPGFYDHASNLLLSCVLVLMYGLVRLLQGARLREVTMFALVVVAANYLYEGGLTLWNTTDLVDAHYGAVGALLGWAFFGVVARHGMAPAVDPASGESAPE